jgi:hypothetical protein
MTARITAPAPIGDEGKTLAQITRAEAAEGVHRRHCPFGR